ncbi:MAG: hypothetical protein JOZ72_15265 [Alphaproteobacteria bacterium]|nr:hypothetical protein [Alphaproteobacteria bacterium]
MSKVEPPGIFINCPFDTAYKPIFDAIIFAMFDCGYVPRGALEAVDSAEARLSKLLRIIWECDFAVHDISRIELDRDSGLPRFNMPFELGLYLGAREFGGGRHRRKICLILDKDRYRFQKFLSDIAGQDITAHRGKPENAVHAIRNWLSASTGVIVPGAQHVWRRYLAFKKDLPALAREAKLKVSEIQFADRRKLIEIWLKRFESVV